MERLNKKRDERRRKTSQQSPCANQEEAVQGSVASQNAEGQDAFRLSSLATPKAKGALFSAEEDAYLRACNSATRSLTWAQIGESMGRDGDSVSGRWYRIQKMDLEAKGRADEVTRAVEAKKIEARNATSLLYMFNNPPHTRPVKPERVKPYGPGDSPPRKRQSQGSIHSLAAPPGEDQDCEDGV